MPRGRQRVYTDIRGWVSGRLVILDEVAHGYAETIRGGDGRSPDRRIRCSCACGRETVVRLNDFMQGKSRSCGCNKGPKGPRKGQA
jgi:hypothetical protein